MDTTATINACDAKLQKLGISALTPVERTIALASIANFEFEMGDVGSFFHNSASKYSAQIIEALLALGATTEAAAIRRGRDLLRANSWETLVVSGAFEPITALYRSGEQDLFTRLSRYVEAHAAELNVQGIT